MRFAQIRLEDRFIRTRCDGPADQVHGPPVIAHLVSHYAQQMQRVSMIGALSQDAIVCPCC